MRHSGILAIVLALASRPAIAHQGDHTHLDLAAFFAHIFEPDHIVFAGIAALVGAIAYRAGRRAEARAIARKEAPHDPR